MQYKMPPLTYFSVFTNTVAAQFSKELISPLFVILTIAPKTIKHMLTVCVRASLAQLCLIKWKV